MKKLISFLKPGQAIQVALASLITFLAAVVIVSATTSIGTNISTDGTLTVTGTSSFADVLYIDKNNERVSIGQNEYYGSEFSISNASSSDVVLDAPVTHIQMDGQISSIISLQSGDNTAFIQLIAREWNSGLSQWGNITADWSTGLAGGSDNNFYIWDNYSVDDTSSTHGPRVIVSSESGNVAVGSVVSTAFADSKLSVGGNFFVGTSSFENPAFYVNQSIGRVGIGTSDPQYKLDVDGDINISSSSAYKIGGENFMVSSTTLGNLFIGYRAGRYNTPAYEDGYLISGFDNTFIGVGTAANNTTGKSNLFVGDHAGSNNTTGYSNLFLGSAAGSYNATGSNNIYIGNSSAPNNSTGKYNLFIGEYTGFNNLIGQGNVFIGYKAGWYEIGSNKLYISNSNTNNLIYGDFSTGNVSIGTTTAPATLDIYSHTATSTLQVDSGTADKGSCLKLKDSDGVGYTYCTFNDGVMSCSTESCE